jgi:hypothetical protein
LLYIANAISHLGDDGLGMWNEEDRFFYDVLHMPDGCHVPLCIRSMVGPISMYAIETLGPRVVDKLQGFKRRLEWFVENRKSLTANVACMQSPAEGERRLLSIVNADQLRRVLRVMLDENEFLSPYGIFAHCRVRVGGHCIWLPAIGAMPSAEILVSNPCIISIGRLIFGRTTS